MNGFKDTGGAHSRMKGVKTAVMYKSQRLHSFTLIFYPFSLYYHFHTFKECDFAQGHLRILIAIACNVTQSCASVFVYSDIYKGTQL